MSLGEQGRKNARKLPSLDLGRFFAALLVVLFHNSFIVYNLTGAVPFGMFFRGGHSGVEYFFVLSGFIIFHVHRSDFGHPTKLKNFARKRVIRIVPMLWLTLIPWGLLKLASAQMGTNEPITPLNLLQDMFLLPHSGGTVLGVIWTLRRELIFYILFATVIANRRVGLLVMILWQFLVVAQQIHPFMGGVEPGMLLGTANLGFGLGMLIAILVNRRPVQNGALWIGVGIIAYLGVMIAEWRIGGPYDASYRPMGGILNDLLYLAAASAVVIGMASRDMLSPKAESRLISALGGCSYALYLVHLPVGSILIRALKPLWAHTSPEMLMLLLSFGSILFALAIHQWVEKPLLRLLKPRSRQAREG